MMRLFPSVVELFWGHLPEVVLQALHPPFQLLNLLPIQRGELLGTAEPEPSHGIFQSLLYRGQAFQSTAVLIESQVDLSQPGFLGAEGDVL